MPSIMEGSILIMSKAGAGISMFCIGETTYIRIYIRLHIYTTSVITHVLYILYCVQ